MKTVKQNFHIPTILFWLVFSYSTLILLAPISNGENYIIFFEDIIKEISFLFFDGKEFNTIIAHFFIFFTLFILIQFARGPFTKNFKQKLLFIVSFALLTEIIQIFLSYREGSITDIAINFLGITFATIIITIVKKIKAKML